jgi:uncharacterized cupin superfamily protein
MSDEAPPVDSGAGAVPQCEGWFVVNTRDAAWLRHETFGARCTFEADGRMVHEQPALLVQQHAQLGVRLHVLDPGKPSTLYHRESDQEDFLVLSGQCLLIVEGEERPLGAWDFFHCAPGTSHSFVGAGDRPCVMLMVGARGEEKTILYQRDETALRNSAGVEGETSSPRDAYAPFGHWSLGRPDSWDELPWS